MTRRTFLAASPVLAALPPALAAEAGPGLFELRRYLAARGRREELIAMFEAHFLDAYERAGAVILGTFRDLDDPDRWVWIRAFADAEGRDAALRGFYGSETWASRAAACNATIADASDARLLAAATGEVLRRPPPRPAAGATPGSVFEVSLYETEAGAAASFAGAYAAELAPGLEPSGAAAVATFVTAEGVKADPRRPVRRETYFVAIHRFDSTGALEAFRRAREVSPDGRSRRERLARRARSVETWRLAPTERSAIR